MIRLLAAIATTACLTASSAAAQTNKQSWNDLLKPYEAKTNPNVPIAPPATPTQSIAPTTKNNPLVDGCVISAIGRLPKADGLRVTKSSYEFLESNFIGSQRTELYDVFVSVDLNGRQASYGWRCLVYENRAATLHPR